MNASTMIQQPPPLQQDGNLANNWKEWKLSFDCFLIAAGKDSVSSKEKCGLFIHVIGKYGREIFEELDVSEAEKHDYDILRRKFSEYCDPAKNINYERHMFFETYQNEKEFDKFIGELKVNSKNCEFGSLRNSLILTQLIRGLKETHMREKLLAKSTLTLEEASQWCRAAERAGRQGAACEASAARAAAAAAGPLGAVERLARGAPGASGRQRARRPVRGRRPPAPAATPRQYMPHGSVCGKCSYNHGNNRCPASSVQCYRCDKFGHFAKCCQMHFTREVLEEDDSNGEECGGRDNGELLMYNISIESSSNGSCDSWCSLVNVNGVEIKFKLDSGADASVMSLCAYRRAGFIVNNLKKCSTVLREISKKRLPVLGYFDAILKCKDKSCKQKIFVLDINCNNLLGLNACLGLNLIARCDQISLYNVEVDESMFSGIGCLPNECNIQIDESVPPVVSATRKIPMKLRPRLKKELDNMENLRIIKKEDGPTDWVSSIVVVEKPNKSLRICLDPRNLNRAVKRSHFQLPTLDEISSNLSGARYFSKCDAKNGFWMIKLTKQSSKLCTFSTPFGRYRFLRLPFGINCAPEVFHNEMYKIFKLEGVEVYIDDLLIWGKNKQEHDDRLKEVIRRAKENGVKLNRDKCVFGVEEISFLGHKFDKNGMRPDESRVRAIMKMPTPEDKKGLERFLGITNYLARFIPRYSEISAPLRGLLGKNVDFDWQQIHEKTFVRLKSLISSAPVLKYYSPNEPVTVSVDASSHGLGACLMQDGRPVAYAARTLTPTESSWAQIEKELLAVVFGCTRFHQYIYGHHEITVESDHKPLESIFKKQLNETPARLQRLLLKLQNYCVKLQYKRGRLLFIADTLSRAAVEPAAHADRELCDDVTVHVNTLLENVEATQEMLEKIKVETEKDDTLNKVCQYYYAGWPNNKREVNENVRHYWTIHDELHMVEGILFRKDTVVIPTSLREEMLRRIHEGHLGIDKCQRRARDVMWWPGMNADIQRVVLRCDTCQRHRAANPRQPLAPHPIPELPWEVLATDLFEFGGKQYLLVVDYFSKFVEIALLPNIQSATVVAALKNMFSRFGIPQKIVSDNGTQFSSQEFKTFSESWGFTHVTSSPLYPRSNGLAERNVRTIKSLLTKALESREDWQLALLNFRNSALTGEQYSPAQLLMGRRLRSRLPAGAQALRPVAVNADAVRAHRATNTQASKRNYDRGTRDLPTLQPEESVRMRNNKQWIKSKVVKPAQDKRSYWVQTENGSLFRRNRQHLMKVPQSDNCNYRCTDRYIDLDDQQPNSIPSQESPSPALTTPTQPGVVTTRSGRVVRPPRRFIEID